MKFIQPYTLNSMWINTFFSMNITKCLEKGVFLVLILLFILMMFALYN